jgi:hypothetical protein
VFYFIFFCQICFFLLLYFHSEYALLSKHLLDCEPLLAGIRILPLFFEPRGHAKKFYSGPHKFGVPNIAKNNRLQFLSIYLSTLLSNSIVYLFFVSLSMSSVIFIRFSTEIHIHVLGLKVCQKLTLFICYTLQKVDHTDFVDFKNDKYTIIIVFYT